MNIGKVFWNKGGKYSKEMIEKICVMMFMYMANFAYRERLKASYNGFNVCYFEYM